MKQALPLVYALAFLGNAVSVFTYPLGWATALHAASAVLTGTAAVFSALLLGK